MLLPTLLAVLCAPHPESLSSSSITVRGERVTVAIRCQTASVLESLGSELDLDGDGLLSPPELDVLRDELCGYLLDHYRLAVGSDDPARAAQLPGRLVELGPDAREPSPFDSQQWLAATLAFEHGAPLPDLLIRNTMFQDASPNHEDLCELRFNDAPLVEAKFWAGEPLRYYAPPGAAGAAASTLRPIVPFGEWVGMGVRHILSGPDHLAFVIGLLVAAGSLGALLGVITAFTLAHSVTLALAALGVLDVPSRPVELVIAASIAWVGIANLLQRRPVARWKEAFGFGLVHGLGFAGFLGEALAGQPRVIGPLVGFNLGVEAGQLGVVAAVLVLLWALRAARGREAADEEPRWLAPRPVRMVASLGVAAAGLFWAVERALG